MLNIGHLYGYMLRFKSASLGIQVSNIISIFVVFYSLLAFAILTCFIAVFPKEQVISRVNTHSVHTRCLDPIRWVLLPR